MEESKAAVILLGTLLITACDGGDSDGGNGNNPPANNTVLISSFAPTAGTAGTRVQIEGLLFADSPAQNSVHFNGVAATIISANPTTIIADVPAGATTGPIQVNTQGASATTSQNFTVLTDTTTPGLSWTTRLNSVPHSISALANNGTTTVLISDDIHTSENGLVWNKINFFSAVSDVMWDGSMFVAVGGWSSVYSSPDGLVWSEKYTIAAPTLKHLTKTATTWVAVGEAGLVQTSTDTDTWVTQTTPTSADLVDIAWNGSSLAAIGPGGTVITSTDNGVTWTLGDAGTTNDFNAIGANKGLFVAAVNFQSGGPDARFFTSPDGIAWTPRSNNNGYIRDIIYANNQWLAVGNYHVYTSPDGINWTATQGNATNHIDLFDAVTYTGTEYMAAGSTGFLAGGVYTSIDGTNWSVRSTDVSHQSIAQSPVDGRLVVSDFTGQTMTSTDDGFNWQYGDESTTKLFIDVDWSELLGRFVAVTQIAANTGVLTSTDGLAWTQISGGVPNKGIASSSTLLVTVGGGTSGGAIRTSTDGLAWTTRANTASQALNDAIWTGSQFLAFGVAGNILTSPDGITWSSRNSGVTQNLRDAAATSSLLVIVGNSGTIITSANDGITWTARNSNTTFNLNAIEWTGNEFVAVGSSGRTVRSVDGINWTHHPNQYNSVPFMSDPINMRDLVWTSSGHLVGIGDNGLIATSP